MFMISRKLIIGLVAFSALLTTNANAVNLVVNGDFSAGNIDVNSAYQYAAPSPSGGPATGGLYTITSASGVGSATYWSWSVPSGISGNVLLANGASTTYQNVTYPGSPVWSQTVNVTANTNYVFSFELAAVDGSPYANIQPTIDGTNGPDLVASQSSWLMDSFTWNSGSNTTASLSLSDLDTTEQNNDFAITDISLTSASANATPEPATMALFGFGLAGLAGLRLRRKE